MIIPAILFLCGSLCLLYWPGPLPNWPWLIAVGAGAVACIITRRYVWLALPLGFIWAWAHAAWQLTTPFPDAWVGQDIVIQGRIVSLPQQHGRQYRFIFACEQWQPPATEVISCRQRFRLSWHAPHRPPRAGERWQLSVRLKPPIGFMNPGGFDYEKWLFQQRISATGYVRPKAQVRLLETAHWSLNQFREQLADRIRAATTDQAGAAGVLALALGIRDGLTPEDWQRFQQTGTSHLVAISGLHVGMISLFGMSIGRWLWSRSQRLTNRIPAQQFGLLLAAVLAIGYAALAGFSIPTQRALIMVLTLLVYAWLRVEASPWQALASALLLVLVIDPFSVLDQGFWLSFAAVAIIFLLLSRQSRQSSGSQLFQGWRISFILTLALFPLTLLFFHYVSLHAPLANLLAVPWVSLVVLPLTLLGSLLISIIPDAGQLLLILASHGFSALNQMLDWLLQWPVTGLQLAAPDHAALLLAGLGVIWLLLPRGVPLRGLGAILLLPALTPPAPNIAQGEARVTLLDVGQGLSVVVQTQQHVLVFDTGPRFPSGFNTGDAVLQPFLLEQGLDHVDRLIVSHGDNDHIGGAAALAAAMPVYRVLTGVPDKFEERYVQRCTAGQHWSWDGVKFEILHPAPAARWSGNDGSCVLKVSSEGHSLLIPGDIEARAERHLLQQPTLDLAAEVLIAPHHGSRSSSTLAFIAAVDPDWVLFPAARHNRYHFPAAQVSERYRQRGIASMSTGRHGAIAFELGAENTPLRPRSYRLNSPQIWRYQA